MATRKAKTYVYFNLHKHVWSVMVRGRVQRHAEAVTIIDADFVVRAAGHAKVLREKRKNVHAFVRGTETRGVATSKTMSYDPAKGGGIQLSYNPYKGPHFYRKDTGEVVESARVVELRADRSVWAWGVTGANGDFTWGSSLAEARR
jgi:hypothetical protein